MSTNYPAGFTQDDHNARFDATPSREQLDMERDEEKVQKLLDQANALFRAIEATELESDAAQTATGTVMDFTDASMKVLQNFLERVN
jgi:hypothetical protein